MQRFRTHALSAALACLVPACASIPPPTEQMAVSQATLDEARRAGAPTYASLPFSNARSNLDAARAAMDAGDNREAARLAAEAEMDARVAAERARAVQAEAAHAEVQRSLDALRTELSRQR